MTKGKIDDVDVVSDTSAVRSGIIVAKDIDEGQRANGDSGDVGHEVVGDPSGVLANEAGLVGADGVEVAEEDDRGGRIGDLPILQDVLDKELGSAVGVGAGEGECFVDGDGFGNTINCGRRGENDLKDVMGFHAFEQNERASNVVLVVLERYFYALANGFETCKVDDRVDGGVLVKYLVESLFVGDVDLVEMGHYLFAGDLLDAKKALLAAVAEVVDDNNVVACVEKLDDGVAPNEACSSSDKYGVLSAHFALYMCVYMYVCLCVCVCFIYIVKIGENL